MRKSMTAMAAVFVFTACDGDPFLNTTTTTPTTPTPTPVDVGNVSLPVGVGSTITPSAAGRIDRYETDGETQDVTYDATTDKITINNLPFDGTGVFDRDNVWPTLNPTGFQVYENNNVTERRAYKAVRGVSPSGNASVTVVRTGDYQGYGFGGFVYSREGGVTLPTTGQATYTGAYAGLRVFEGAGGLQYTTANALLEVDFEDFDATDAVEGRLTNRLYYDQNGNVLGALPTLILATGSITTAGEIGGSAGSQTVAGGAVVPFESGEYYAVLSGSGANEMVGVIIVTGDDPNDLLDGGTGIPVQETGGFVVTTP